MFFPLLHFPVYSFASLFASFSILQTHLIQMLSMIITISESFFLLHLPSHSNVPSFPLLFSLFCNILSSKYHASYIHLSGATYKSRKNTAKSHLVVQICISICSYFLSCLQSAGKNKGVHNARN